MPLEHRPESVPQRYPELVKLLAQEIHHPSASIGPRIIEQKSRGLDRYHVSVIWDRWAGVDPADRADVILEAYVQAKSELEMLRISLAIGLTPDEAVKLRVA